MEVFKCERDMTEESKNAVLSSSANMKNIKDGGIDDSASKGLKWNSNFNWITNRINPMGEK